MKLEITNPRLYAFFNSRVLNSLMIVNVVGLLLINYTKNMLLPAVGTLVSLVLFVGYILWFWIKKPERIIINRWLSDVTGYFTLYFLIVIAMKDAGQWWYIFAIACAVVAMFISLVKPQDENFIISR